MSALAISLGHNASAVLIEDGRIVAGYEEERFSGQKADSAFPIRSIVELGSRFFLPKDTDCYVGHWFLDARLPQPNKYWDPEVLGKLFPDGQIHSLSPDFTHHDSHLASAMVFAGDTFADSYSAVVADGFGSFGECMSFYEVQGASWKLTHRVWGFYHSLGLLYQYATAFMGMKMHNHEYKMLAYEVLVNQHLTYNQRMLLCDMVEEEARKRLKALHKLSLGSKFDPLVSVDALPNLQLHINGTLSEVLFRLGILMTDTTRMRVAISYFVQHVVESVMSTMTALWCKSKSLLVVGGLFYNVKLNHILANRTDHRFCAMPLAGDQGAALGVYEHYRGDLKWPGHLNWGLRNLIVPEDEEIPPGVRIVDDEDAAFEVMSGELNSKGLVNLVRGPMEFGPRALCNTSTIAIPDRSVAEDINRMNDRTMEMPFAPVMTYSQAEEMFKGIDKIHRSLGYMIVTRDYRFGCAEPMPGAAHGYPDGSFTGRPQITTDPLLVDLLNRFGPLINTSFNFHGVPIVRDIYQILDTHVRQWRAAPDVAPTTVIIRSQA